MYNDDIIVASSSAYVPSICEQCGARGLQKKTRLFYEQSKREYIKRTDMIMANLNEMISKTNNDGSEIYLPPFEDHQFDDIAVPSNEIEKLKIDMCCMEKILTFVPFDTKLAMYYRIDNVNPIDFTENGIELFDMSNNNSLNQKMSFSTKGTSLSYDI